MQASHITGCDRPDFQGSNHRLKLIINSKYTNEEYDCNQIQEVFQVVNEIDAPSLEKKLATGNEVFLLDIRSATEVTRGILPTSRHIPMHLLPLRMNEFPKDRDVVLYCHSGNRSYHACTYLMQQGFRNVVNLRGGILDWARNGFQVEAPAC